MIYGYLIVLAIRKLEDEEESYISKRYRHLQHNMRESAIRASKQVYMVSAKRFFCQQTMVSNKSYSV